MALHWCMGILGLYLGHPCSSHIAAIPSLWTGYESRYYKLALQLYDRWSLNTELLSSPLSQSVPP